MKILVADDDPISLKLLSKVVTKWGYQLAAAADGMAAWAELSKEEDGPKIAVLDWDMPGMDGVELCKVMRQKIHITGFVYIIMLTSRDEPEDIIAALDAGASAYLVKPIDQEELKSRIAVGERAVAYQNAILKKYHELHENLLQLEVAYGAEARCDAKLILTQLEDQMKLQLYNAYQDLNYLKSSILNLDVESSRKSDLITRISSLSSNLNTLNQLLHTNSLEEQQAKTT